MVVSPIGTWLIRMDASILTSTDVALQGIAPLLAIPVTAAALLFLAARGVRITNGDGGALQSLWFDCIKIVFVFGLSLNLGNYDYYIRDFFYTSLPGALNAGIAGGGVATGVDGTAATFDLLYNQAWDQVAAAWSHAGLTDFGTVISAQLCGLTMAGALMAMALVYLLARLLLGVVLVFGPICIACSLTPQTGPIFERWMGKVVALVCLEVAGIIVLVMVFNADKQFMAQIAPLAAAPATGGWLGTDGSPAPSVASDIANLTSMVVWFGMGAFALYSLPAIAYSIGSGVALQAAPVALALAAAATTVGAAIGAAAAGAAGLGAAAGGGGAALSLSLAEDALEGGASGGSLPPPPPPSLATATPPALGAP